MRQLMRQRGRTNYAVSEAEREPLSQSLGQRSNEAMKEAEEELMKQSVRQSENQ